MAIRHEPPQTLRQWRTFEAWCGYLGEAAWFPQDFGIRDWPDEIKQGPGWIPFAEDHPFKGQEFCWRCIADAQGFPCPAPHRREVRTICWGPAEGDEAAEHTEQDGSPSGEVGIADPARPTLASAEEHKAWWDAGRRLVAEDRPVGLTDTGQGFWPPVPGAAVTVHGQDGEILARGKWLGVTKLDATGQPVPPPEPWDGFPSWTDPTVYPAGWCAPADYETAAEPVPADFAQRFAQLRTQPLETYEAEDANRQSGTDAEE